MFSDIISIRVRLLGTRQAAAEADALNASIASTAKATEEANAKTAASAKSAAAASAASTRRQVAAMRTLGHGLTTYVTTPLLAIGAASAVLAANFDRQMSLIATDAGGSAREVAKLKGEVLSLARGTQFTPTALAEALFHIESSGYRGAQAMKVLHESTRLATVGNSDLQKTTYGLVSATKTLYGEGLGNIGKTAAQLNEIVAHGDIRQEELVSAMATGILPKAKAVGLGIQDVGSALDVMTARGIPAQRAAYALGFVLQKLIPSTSKAAGVFKELGLGQEELIHVAQKRGLPDALDLLKSKLKGVGDEAAQTKVIQEMFGGGRMTSGLLTVIQNLDEAHLKYHQINGDVALYNKHTHEAEQQPLVKAKAAWAEVEAALIEIGQVILPAAIPLMESFAGGVESVGHLFAGLSSPMQSTLLDLGLMAAAMGPLLSLTAKFVKSWQTMAAASATGGGMGIGKRVGIGFAGMAASQIAGTAIGGSAGSAVSNIGTGAALGFGVGGPWGAVAGGVAGAALTFGPDLLGLADSERKLTPLQERLKSSSKAMGDAYMAAGAQVANMRQTEGELTAAHKRHDRATWAVSQAQSHLNNVRLLSGPDSHAAIRAEINLARAKHQVTAATRAESKAERKQGIERQVTKELLREAITQERRRIRVLNSSEKALLAQRESLKRSGDEGGRLKSVNEALTKVWKRQNEAGEAKNKTELQAVQEIGPKYAKFLRHGSERALEFGGSIKAAAHEVGALNRKLEELEVNIGLAAGTLEGGTFEAQKGVVQEELERAQHQRHEAEDAAHKHHHHHGGGAHGRFGAGPAPGAGRSLLGNFPTSPQGSSYLRHRRAGGGRTTADVTVPLMVGRRQLAEAVVTVQHDDEARE